nr:MAG TPA: hypothetical protein [Caudoviricetes sp.]DAN68525.1 MAG TPA: hypothetical protein [Caudoviricetes sp.]DAR25399.1 MAG TPA: hypothetical protein [Caudoviricetes sp.]
MITPSTKPTQTILSHPLLLRSRDYQAQQGRQQLE